MRAIIGPQANTPGRNILQVIRHSNFRPTDSKKYIFPDLNFTHFLNFIFNFLFAFSLFSNVYFSYSSFFTLLLNFSVFSPYIFIIPSAILFYSIHFITFSPLFNF
jgi:hypothetical protein